MHFLDPYYALVSSDVLIDVPPTDFGLPGLCRTHRSHLDLRFRDALHLRASDGYWLETALVYISTYPSNLSGRLSTSTHAPFPPSLRRTSEHSGARQSLEDTRNLLTTKCRKMGHCSTGFIQVLREHTIADMHNKHQGWWFSSLSPMHDDSTRTFRWRGAHCTSSQQNS
jgi:hypothetical protein